MRKLTLFSCIFLFTTKLTIAQSELTQIKTDKLEYAATDSIKVSFSTEGSGLLWSNHGGCSPNIVYVVECLNDPNLSVIQKDCDLLLTEYDYLKEGSFIVQPIAPETYRIVLYRQVEHVSDTNRYSLPVYSQEFIVK